MEKGIEKLLYTGKKDENHGLNHYVAYLEERQTQEEVTVIVKQGILPDSAYSVPAYSVRSQVKEGKLKERRMQIKGWTHLYFLTCVRKRNNLKKNQQ